MVGAIPHIQHCEISQCTQLAWNCARKLIGIQAHITKMSEGAKLCWNCACQLVPAKRDFGKAGDSAELAGNGANQSVIKEVDEC